MNFGPSLQKRPIKSGFGWHFVERPGKLLAMPLAIVMKPPVASSGGRERPSIGVVHVTPIFGRRIKRSSPSPNTVQLAKRVDKRRILSVGQYIAPALGTFCSQNALVLKIENDARNLSQIIYLAL